jgi:hypothetical protein
MTPFELLQGMELATAHQGSIDGIEYDPLSGPSTIRVGPILNQSEGIGIRC